MESIVTNQYPQVVFRDGDKYLWNPIQKKAFENRPEERIRLRVIEYLLAAGWSKHRISTEEGVISTERGKLRTDLICYSRSFEPMLLVECKAPAVRISNQTAEQIARYNSNVKAPTLLMTNGRTDLWYAFQGQQPEMQSSIPEPFKIYNQPKKQSFEYWVGCGFAGKKADPDLRKWLVSTLNKGLYNNSDSIQYLSFKKALSDIDLSHYYQIVEVAGGRIALALVAASFGGSRLVAIKNEDGANKALLEINLDLLFDQQSPNASLYNSEGIENIAIQAQIDWEPASFDFQTFARALDGLFASLT